MATLTASLQLFFLSAGTGRIDCPEIALRLVFLYLLAVPVGLLSERVRKDKLTVDTLNSELARSLQNLKATQANLIEAEKFSALGRLTAYIAHEIRNPLTAVGGFARRLEKKLPAGSPEKEYAAILVKEVNRLEKILLDTLIYGKAGDLKLARSGLNTPAAAAASLYRDDTGPGIDPEIIDFVFEPFYSTKKIGIGTGLGLPIVKKIMDEHCGLIDVRNLPGQGASFTLCFPWQSEEQDLMTPCWEFLKCGIEMDAARRCGAFPYFGRICWTTAGSFGPGGIEGICAQKIENCRDCSFYQIVNASLPLYTGGPQPG